MEIKRVTLDIYKSTKFTPFVGRTGQLCFRPVDRSLVFFKSVKARKVGGDIQIPERQRTQRGSRESL